MFSETVSKSIEDFLYVNQLTSKNDLEKLSDPKNEDKVLTRKELVQVGHRFLLDQMELNNQKLFEQVKKKLGMQREVFNSIT